MNASLQALSREVRMAARALARHGLVHAYGHCSARLDAQTCLVSPPRPLGLVGAGEACSIVPLEGELPQGVLPEVRIHREIYRLRPDVHAVARIQPPKLMSLGALGCTPYARHGFGAYFYPSPPLWDDPQLVRDDMRARQLAAHLGAHAAIVMRGNGAVTVADSLQTAVVLAWYLEDAARVELDCMAAGLADIHGFSAAEAAARATWAGGLGERMWAYLSAGDIEAEPDCA